MSLQTTSPPESNIMQIIRIGQTALDLPCPRSWLTLERYLSWSLFQFLCSIRFSAEYCTFMFLRWSFCGNGWWNLSPISRYDYRPDSMLPNKSTGKVEVRHPLQLFVLGIWRDEVMHRNAVSMDFEAQERLSILASNGLITCRRERWLYHRSTETFMGNLICDWSVYAVISSQPLRSTHKTWSVKG